MSFGRGLRSILRQDPDIVLVGEIRDGETAELALRASLTGHLVLSTLHTNGAAAALPRMVDMGAAPYLVASSLTCVVGQRLVRTPCVKCAKTYEPSDAVLELLRVERSALRHTRPRRGVGCARCSNTGYYGRLGVFEVMKVTRPLRELLLSGADDGAMTALARQEGMSTLRESGLKMASRGLTTYEEVARVTPADGD
jgi:type IV pilus assembly protein PilB